MRFKHFACPLPLLQGTPHFGENFRGLVLGCMGTYDSESRRTTTEHMDGTCWSDEAIRELNDSGSKRISYFKTC